MSNGVWGFQKGDLNPSRNPIRREQIRRERTGKSLGKRQKQRISRSMKQALKNPILKEKWRQAKLGLKLSEETKAKIAYKRSLRPKSLTTYIRVLDKVYSKYIRAKNRGADGLVACFTCGKRYQPSNIDCGHYISRMFKNTRFMEENTQPQCWRCNRYMDGEKDIFAIRLQEKYGSDILSRLNQARHVFKQYTIPELESLIDSYKCKLQELTEKDGPISGHRISDRVSFT